MLPAMGCLVMHHSGAQSRPVLVLRDALCLLVLLLTSQAGEFFMSSQMDAAVHQNQREIEEATSGGSSSEDAMDRPLLLEQVSAQVAVLYREEDGLCLSGAFVKLRPSTISAVETRKIPVNLCCLLLAPQRL